jgi:serine/threonine-protein kinase
MQPDQIQRLQAALADRYVIERELGRGGAATVYLADDLKHDRKVALKVLRPELAAALGPGRFAREVAIAARLSHPNILALHDSGEAGGFLFYVMPHVQGESLRHRLRREAQLPIEEAIRVTRQVASALAHAHAQQVIHRDIKPENILLYEGVAMVADFGIALTVNSSPSDRLTETGFLIGTPEYMSPEQAAGERALDARSDVYSLACVLHEMLAGAPPFTGPSTAAVIARHMIDPVPAVRRLRGDAPAALEAALAKALAKAPEERFPSAAAFAAALVAPVAAKGAAPSVAVLPFRNLSPDPENEYFADGITEDVIAHLSKIRALKVISRTSVMRFKNQEQSLREIGALLEATTILEGSVRRAGDRVRIVAQLIDVATDQHLWAETYDRQLTDIFAIQTDVALQIAAALKAELDPNEQTRIRRAPTSDLGAYQLYLQGRHCLLRDTEEEILKAINYFEQAITRDPAYALAYVGIARAYGELGRVGAGAVNPDVAYRKARVAVAKALELDAGLGEAHSMLGFLRFMSDFDWIGAEQEFKRALELDPGSADTCDLYAQLCSALERYDETLSLQERARELDPLSQRTDITTTLLRCGRYEEALRAAEGGVEFDPHFARSQATLGWACLKLGMNERGVAALRKAVALAPEGTLFQAQLGQALASAGNVAEARSILQQLEELSWNRYVSPVHLAYVQTGLGELDAAIDSLEQAFEQRAGGMYGIKGSFLFLPLRGHPRFTALLKRMNLA